MNSKITSPIPEPIVQLQRQLDQFRSTRPHRTKLPDALWEGAAELARQHGVYPVAHPLGLDYTKLKKRLRGSGGAVHQSRRDACLRPHERAGKLRTHSQRTHVAKDHLSDCLVIRRSCGGVASLPVESTSIVLAIRRVRDHQLPGVYGPGADTSHRGYQLHLQMVPNCGFANACVPTCTAVFDLPHVERAAIRAVVHIGDLSAPRCGFGGLFLPHLLLEELKPCPGDSIFKILLVAWVGTSQCREGMNFARA